MPNGFSLNDLVQHTSTLNLTLTLILVLGIKLFHKVMFGIKVSVYRRDTVRNMKYIAHINITTLINSSHYVMIQIFNV